MAAPIGTNDFCTVLRQGACLGVAALFLFSGVAKAADVSTFAATVESHGFVPPRWAATLGGAFAWVEIAVGIWCLFSATAASGLSRALGGAASS